MPPQKVIDVQALAGDSTDNVPGAPGIGIKTAAQLINEYGDLDTLLARAGEIKQPKRRETLTNPEIVEQVRVSKKLVELVCDVAAGLPARRPRPVAARRQDARRLPEGDGVHHDHQARRRSVRRRRGADRTRARAHGRGRLAPAQRSAGANGPRNATMRLRKPPRGTRAPPPLRPQRPASEADSPAALAAARLREHRALAQKIDVKSYETVTSEDALDRWIAQSYEAGRVCVDTETSSLDAFDADLVGVALATAPGRACYIPIRHCKSGSPDDLFQEGGLVEGQLPRDLVLAKLKPLLEDPGVLKIAQNMKFDLEILREQRRQRARRSTTRCSCPTCSTRARTATAWTNCPQRHLGHKPIQFGEVAGVGKTLHRLRPRGHRQGDGVFRRGRGRDAAPVGGAEAAARRRGHDARVRDAGAPAHRRAGAHGAARHRHRPADSLAPLGRVRAGHGAAGGRHSGDRRRAVQPRLAQAARRHPVRQDGPAGRQEDGDGRMVDDRERARRTRRTGPRTAGAHSRMALSCRS